MKRRLAAGVLLAAMALVNAGCVTVVRSSVGTGNVEGNAQSTLFRGPAISDTGRYVAFDSTATNLVPNDTNGAQDVFRHDNATGRTIRVSVTTAGAAPGADSWGRAISGDGNHVAFQTVAALDAQDTNGRDDIYVRTVSTGTTERVSIRPDGSPILGAGIGFSIAYVSLSHDGSIVFMVQGDLTSEIFRRDRNTDTTVEDPGDSGRAFLSSDGRHYVWSKSCAVSGPCLGTTNLRTIAADGSLTGEPVEPTCGFWPHDLSEDGSFVVGERFANMPQFGCEGPFGLVRWNRATKHFAPVPVPSFQEEFVRISHSGRIISVLGTDGVLRVVDMATGEVQVADTDAFGNPGPGRAGSAALSGSGRYVTFTTLSPITRDDDNHVDDVFTRYSLLPSATGVQPGSVTRGGPQQLLTVTGSDFLPGAKVAFSGQGINVDSATVTSPRTILVAVTVGSGAAVGEREMVVSNNGGFGHADAHCVGCVTVR